MVGPRTACCYKNAHQLHVSDITFLPGRPLFPFDHDTWARTATPAPTSADQEACVCCSTASKARAVSCTHRNVWPGLVVHRSALRENPASPDVRRPLLFVPAGRTEAAATFTATATLLRNHLSGLPERALSQAILRDHPDSSRGPRLFALSAVARRPNNFNHARALQSHVIVCC